MGIPTSIKTLLSGSAVEWARIEYKVGWDPSTTLKTICAFANDFDNWGGGYIVLGVEERNGRPVFPLKGLPVDQVDRIQKDMLNKCKLIQPGYLPIVEAVDYQDCKLLVVWVPGGNQRPYSSPKSMSKDNKERAYYIRKMSSTIVPSNDELRDLFSLSNQTPFDDGINHEAELSDINIALIQNYLREINSGLYEESQTMSLLDLCKSMNIVSILPEYIKPRNVGLLFFCLEPERFFPYARIDVVEFPEDLGGDKIVENIFKGPLHVQLRQALQYIRGVIVQEQVIKLPDVAEARRFFNYPYAAIEEALANAVYHKGYNEREPVEVRILPDRIEIVSHPGPDRSVTIEGLQNYKVFCRRYRNRRIGDFLKELRMTEGRNTGFKKIINALKHNGSPLPIFETDEHRLSFAVTIFQHPEFPVNTVEYVGGNVLAKDDDMDDDMKGREKSREKSREKIIGLIKNNEFVTQDEIAKSIGLSVKGVEKNIAKLKANGIIERVGPDNGGYWRVNK